MDTTERIERIDGTDYLVGSAEHAIASRQHHRRLDELYATAHRDEVERDVRRLQASPFGERFDANQTAFLARDLLFVRREIERTIYDRLRAAEFIPVDTSIPRGAQSYATRLQDRAGDAKISHDLAGDAPRADVSVTEDIAKLVNVRGSYAYSLQDMEYAAFAGVPLVRDKALACADMIARGLDKIGRVGETTTGLTGFFNNALVPDVTLPNGEWLTATAAEILADLQHLESTMISQSRDEHSADVLVLPTAYEGRLRTLRSDANSDLSVAQYFLANARMIKRIERWIALDDATGTDAGVADPPMGILYPKDPGVLFWPIPISYEEQPPEVRGFEWLVNARARCGGVDVRRPKSMLYVENLD